jgi:hypothetical protein
VPRILTKRSSLMVERLRGPPLTSWPVGHPLFEAEPRTDAGRPTAAATAAWVAPTATTLRAGSLFPLSRARANWPAKRDTGLRGADGRATRGPAVSPWPSGGGSCLRRTLDGHLVTLRSVSTERTESRASTGLHTGDAEGSVGAVGAHGTGAAEPNAGYRALST